jgi:hypothetical protein
MQNREGPDDRFAAIARSLRDQPGETMTLLRAVEMAVDLFDGCQEAGVSIASKIDGSVDTPAATSDSVRRGDQLQYELNEGPCLDALRVEHTVFSSDLSSETRWPRWAPSVVEELDMHSMLCFQLFTTHESLGALNLYSRRVDAFNDTDRTVGLAYAAHVAVALAGARKLAANSLTIVNRTVIGQAEGILMERYALSAGEAFAFLNRIAQGRSAALIEAATEVIQGVFSADGQPA